MATLWFDKDGNRPYTQHGPGIRISLVEADMVFGKDESHYCGREPPSINPAKPSRTVKNVLVEVEESDGTSAYFPNVGFYLLVGVRPAEAEGRLQAYRTAA